MEIQIYLNKKSIDGKPTQVVIYKQCKIMEVVDNQNNFYYLIFHKNKFINGKKTNIIQLNSYLHKALVKGFTFPSEHPVLSELVTMQKSIQFQLIRFNQLFKKLQNHYPPAEIIQIFSYFDAFIPNDQLKKLVKNTYYSYRREGKLYHAYRTLKNFQQNFSEDTFTNDMVNQLEFQSFNNQYQDIETLEMSKKDLDFVESYYFNTISRPSSQEKLISLYQKQNRWLDELCLHLNQEPSNESLHRINVLCLEQFSPNQQIKIWTSLLDKIEENQLLQAQLLEKLIEQNNPNDTILLLVQHGMQPSKAQLSTIATYFQQADQELIASIFPQLNKKLLQLFHNDHKLLENLVHRSITAVFSNYTLNEIVSWLEPFQEAGIHLPVHQKLLKMLRLEENPDQQYALGELYLDFNQISRSIDCFKWEMELNPDNPQPIRLLSNIYRNIGNREEANTYQQLLVHMQK
ncbi:tetratricopeptide repeat protein [Aquibacillus kalidii]|uniref:tetratricopeptide repeat protein n=1 Tax=Aquibacillus kalidii TaxID=2762597 RepID=UPI001644EFFF|nr:hypothetical protein [Aquibacillus kalidii]